MRKENMVISLDLGDVLFDRISPKIEYKGSELRQLHEGSLEFLQELAFSEIDLKVISRIDHGDECKVCMNLFGHGIVPELINPKDVRFCYKRIDKGPIALDEGVTIHVDDRLECLQSIHDCGVPYKVLFTMSNDESAQIPNYNIPGLRIAKNWDDVRSILQEDYFTKF
jgi:hypothetical protein